MKILFVSSGNKSGQVDPLTKAQGESLKNLGIEINYFVIKGKGLSGYIKNIRILKKHLLKSDIDIIHAHYGLCGIVSQFARKKEKLVVSFMGDDLLGSIGKNGKYTLKSLVLSFINSVFARYMFDFNIVKSKNLLEKLIRSSKVKIIPNGVNFDVFFPQNKFETRKELNLRETEKIVLFAADPNRMEKNFTLASEAIKKINLENLVLKVVYNISQQELNKYYNSADLIILTSKHEGSPNVIKEAMACNIPIVCTNVGDVKETISNTPGCFIADQNIESISDKINEALIFNNKTVGRNNIKHLDSRIIANEIIGIYKTLYNTQ